MMESQSLHIHIKTGRDWKSLVQMWQPC